MTTTVLSSEHGRILCIADIRGHLSTLNDLARDVNAVAIIHTGDFGFFGEKKVLIFNLLTVSDGGHNPVFYDKQNPRVWIG